MAAVTYFEISGPDSEALRSFYVEAIGLAPEPGPDSPYLVIQPSDGAISGGIFDGSDLFEEPKLSYAMPYVQVDDVDAAVEQAVAGGATVVASARQHGPTRSAHLLDPCGNRFALYTIVDPT